jgi:hypothetical protein
VYRKSVLAVSPTGVAGANFSGWIKRRSSYDADLVPVASEPIRHFAGVFAVTHQFRSEIDAVDENPHNQSFRESKTTSLEREPFIVILVVDDS